MKLLLLTRHAIGLNALEYLHASYPEDIAAVVTTDRDAVYSSSMEKGLPTFVFESDAALVDALRAHSIQPDLGAMVWWPNIIKEPLLSFPADGFINTHPSLLPYCRGSMSNFWALVEEAPYGVSIHRVDDRVDHGSILAQAGIDVGWEDTDETLYHRSLERLEALFKEYYPRLRQHGMAAITKEVSGGSYHRLAEINAATHIDLDTSTTARRLLNLMRARSYPGAPGCRFVDGDKEYEVRVTIRESGK